MPSLNIGGRSVWYSRGGVEWAKQRPTLVLLHGAGADHTVWSLQARSLAQHGWNVAAPDLPGHGLSEDAADRTSIESLAAWLDELVQSLGCDPISVVGHSMGACIALTHAAHSTRPLKHLALLGAGATMPVNDALLDDTANAPDRAQRFITAFGHGRRAHFGGSESPGLWMLGAGQALLERCPPAVLHRDFSACNAWNGTELPAQIECSTLVIAGATDRMTPPRVGRTLAQQIAGAELIVLPDTGHMMMSEAPSAVTRALRNFLAR